MSKYGIRKVNIHVPNKYEQLNEEQINERNRREDILEQYGVYTALYTDGSIKFPEHPDGIHYYIKDASEARKLVMAGKNLPEDLKERLLYYKSLNWLENQTGNNTED